MINETSLLNVYITERNTSLCSKCANYTYSQKRDMGARAKKDCRVLIGKYRNRTLHFNKCKNYKAKAINQ